MRHLASSSLAHLADALGSLLRRRDSDTQVALLDRIAGTSSQAQRFGGTLRGLREAEAQMEALEALGDEDARDELQAFADEVRCRARHNATGGCCEYC